MDSRSDMVVIKKKIVLYRFQYGKEIVQTTTSDQVMLKMACIKARVVG